MSRIILGIDPGIGRTGYGVISVEGPTMVPIDFGCITTPPNTEVGPRLLELEASLEELVARHQPNVIGVEELLFTNNVTTGIVVGAARGVVLLVAARHHLQIAEYTPTQIKLAVTGDGRAEKSQMQEMVCRLLKLEKRPTPDDAADALAVAICAMSKRF